MKKTYQQLNSETIDRWVADGWEWGKPVSHEVYQAACEGNWDVLLTPTKPVPHDPAVKNTPVECFRQKKASPFGETFLYVGITYLPGKCNVLSCR